MDILSLVPLITVFLPQLDGISFLRVMRMFRLLRIMRVYRLLYLTETGTIGRCRCLHVPVFIG